MGVPFDTTVQPVITPTSPLATAPAPPLTRGEHLLQCAYGTSDRAARFYAEQLRDRLLPAMVEFVARMEMAFIATSDGRGECDASLRAGPRGFIQVLDEKHLAYPEYRGNGVLASLGNITENPNVGMLMVDFGADRVGLHVNGRARVLEDEELRAGYPSLPAEPAPGRRVERWVLVTVEEAYIHCRKHIPRMAPVVHRRIWGTDDARRKGGDYFGVKAERSATPDAVAGPAGPGAGLRYALGSRVRPPFPSTTHLPAGSATARPLRTVPGPRAERAQPRRIRWLSS